MAKKDFNPQVHHPSGGTRQAIVAAVVIVLALTASAAATLIAVKVSVERGPVSAQAVAK